jgi:predicted solute-binding protein
MPRLDLGEAWTNLTGLPFIYAAWMARPGVPLAEIWHRLNAARCEGTEEIAQNAQEVAAKLNLPPSFIQQYMTQNLEYNITSSALSAVDVFRRSLHRGPKSSVPDSDVQTSQGRIFGLERIASRGKP